ncbi:hypothetical protein [Peribacillus deserti]|uniref:hypothetical protein n=1 Tax=Peribacillus deserti TaxID=673318 RepID=UPI0021525465|nr:hypothetical protein [Peribacillus deserti]
MIYNAALQPLILVTSNYFSILLFSAVPSLVIWLGINLKRTNPHNTIKPNDRPGEDDHTFDPEFELSPSEHVLFNFYVTDI